jgi:hypothetical protein
MIEESLFLDLDDADAAAAAAAASSALAYHPSKIERTLESKVRLRLRCSVERILSNASDAEATPVELRLLNISWDLLFFFPTGETLAEETGVETGVEAEEMFDGILVFSRNGSSSLTVMAECCKARSKMRRACCQLLELICLSKVTSQDGWRTLSKESTGGFATEELEVLPLLEACTVSTADGVVIIVAIGVVADELSIVEDPWTLIMTDGTF